MNQLPQRDETKTAEQQGLFQKFIVTRTDGKDAPGQKHCGCEYFVLDATHDIYAKAALTAYAAACAESHPDLSNDMVQRYALPLPEVKQEPAAYFKADQDGNLIWGEDCVSDDAIFDFSDDGESNETSIPLYRLPPDVEALRKENERLSTVEYCFNEWLEKTKWVQETARPHELGMHRADVLRNRIEVLQKEKDELLTALKRLINSDPTGEIPNASDDDLQAAVNDENAGPIVREQAASILQARAAIFKAEGGAA